ncbi:DNA-3-methyladenine glycosylase [Persicitalea jodogahamensis]|uniref:DNA-3-methyladenine glycosylase II n=2 Tax=Persicitalea jodogahamensis TaxID=402147 RepID=A0A8J3D622_9BACT|nr:DNA-3-methyladenine glycosylase [Persicitalea jodogahamensis]
MHRVSDNSVIKPFRVGERVALLEVSQQHDQLLVEFRGGDLIEEGTLREQVVAFFDLETDLSAFYRYLKADADLAYMATDYYGLRLMGIPDLFEALCWSIIGQQINLSFAYSLKRRIVELAGAPIACDGHVFHAFPTPACLAALTVEQLRLLQFSGRKAEYLIGVAQAFEAGEISKAQLMALPTTEEKVQKLTSLRGVGEWTAHYSLMKSLKVPTSVPYGDVGLYNALAALKGLPKRPSRLEIASVFDHFKGWEAYLTIYLWRSLAIQ